MWKSISEFLLSFAPCRVWIVEFDGVKIGWGPKAEAMDDYLDLLTHGDGQVKIYSKWMSRGRFLGLAESTGR